MPEDKNTITLEEVYEFLSDKEVTPKCWFCGKNTVVVLPEQDFDPESSDMSNTQPALIDRVVQENDDTQEIATVPAFVMSCHNCGMTFDMLTVPLKNWKREKKGHGND